jgi:ABC-2 type transport system permease protein
MTTISHSLFMAQRHTRALLRQPWFVAVTLVQPVIWLVLFGQLFRGVAELPVFSGASMSYLEYLTPGVVIMTAIFSSGWSGMGTIEDIERGLLDRYLVGPVKRSSLIVGRVLNDGLSVLVQVTIIGLLATLMGARFDGGIGGFAVLVFAAVLLVLTFASISNAMALVVRQRESLIGMNQFMVLPLTFLSAAFMPLALVPDWIATVARVNPVNWAVEAGRDALLGGSDWEYIGLRLAALLVTALISAAVATRAFRAYQRSV